MTAEIPGGLYGEVETGNRGGGGRRDEQGGPQAVLAAARAGARGRRRVKGDVPQVPLPQILDLPLPLALSLWPREQRRRQQQQGQQHGRNSRLYS